MKNWVEFGNILPIFYNKIIDNKEELQKIDTLNKPRIKKKILRELNEYKINIFNHLLNVLYDYYITYYYN